MNFRINYLENLIKRGRTLKSGKQLITKEQIDENYRAIEDALENKLKWDSEQNRTEHKIELMLAYFNIIAAIQNQTNPKSNDEILDGEEIQAIAKNYEYKAQEKSGTSARDENYNEYHVLKCPNQSPISRIDKTYLSQLKMLESELTQLKEDENASLEKISRIQSLYLEMQEAHRRMSDPAYKARKDEKFLVKFNPNKEKLYSPGSFADISYIPRIETKQENNGKENVSAISFYNFQGDQIQLIKTADVGFGRFRQRSGKITYRDSEALEEYIVLKRYADQKLQDRRKEIAERPDTPSLWFEKGGEEVFVVYTRLGRDLFTDPDVDPEYVKIFTNQLFSTYNMEEAMRHNGGYIGEVNLINDQGQLKYAVVHEKDNLCLAKEITSAKEKYGMTFGGDAKLIALDRSRKDSLGGER